LPLPFNPGDWTFHLDLDPYVTLPSLSLPSLAGLTGLDINGFFLNLPGVGSIPEFIFKRLDVKFEVEPDFSLGGLALAFGFNSGFHVDLPGGLTVVVEACELHAVNPLKLESLPEFSLNGKLDIVIDLPDELTVPLIFSFELIEGFNADPAPFHWFKWAIELDLKRIRPMKGLEPGIPAYIALSIHQLAALAPGLDGLKLPDELTGLADLSFNLFKLKLTFPPGLAFIEKIDLKLALTKPWAIKTGVPELESLKIEAVLRDIGKWAHCPAWKGESTPTFSSTAYPFPSPRPYRSTRGILRGLY
ncbi:MAG: hypothetical protein GY859_26260, partial [Desulfobacterales bacterium]|nr:hypothetical protein [Desulfobacterales bacterium]